MYGFEREAIEFGFEREEIQFGFEIDPEGDHYGD